MSCTNCNHSEIEKLSKELQELKQTVAILWDEVAHKKRKTRGADERVLPLTQTVEWPEPLTSTSKNKKRRSNRKETGGEDVIVVPEPKERIYPWKKVCTVKQFAALRHKMIKINNANSETMSSELKFYVTEVKSPIDTEDREQVSMIVKAEALDNGWMRKNKVSIGDDIQLELAMWLDDYRTSINLVGKSGFDENFGCILADIHYCTRKMK